MKLSHDYNFHIRIIRLIYIYIFFKGFSNAIKNRFLSLIFKRNYISNTWRQSIINVFVASKGQINFSIALQRVFTMTSGQKKQKKRKNKHKKKNKYLEWMRPWSDNLVIWDIFAWSCFLRKFYTGDSPHTLFFHSCAFEMFSQRAFMSSCPK